MDQLVNVLLAELLIKHTHHHIAPWTTDQTKLFQF